MSPQNLGLRVSGITRHRGISGQIVINTFAGNGTNGFVGDGGIPRPAEFNAAAGINFDSAGNVYLCDIQNNRIRVVNMQATSQTIFNVSVGAGQIQTIVGSSGTEGYAGDGGAATSAQLSHPCQIAFDSSGNMYICDQANSAIRMVTTAGIITTICGGAGGFNIGGFGSDNVPVSFPVTACTTASGGNSTYTGTFTPGLAAATKIYIQGFANSANNGWFTLQSTSTATQIVLNNASAVAQSGQTALAMYAQLNVPQGILVDVNGNLIITDTNNDRIRVYNRQGTSQTFFGTSIPAGNLSTVAGGSGFGYSGDGGPATSASLSQPIAATIDANNNLMIADFSNAVIRQVSPSGTISTLAGSSLTITITGMSGVVGSTATYTYTGGVIPAIAATNTAIIISGMQNSANNIAAIITTVGAGTFTVINAGAIVESGSSGTGFMGLPGAQNGAALGTAQFAGPQDIQFIAGTYYIADSRNHQIRTINQGIVATVAGNGTAGYTGDYGLAIQAELKQPVALKVDSHNNIYVGEFGNNLFRKIYQTNGPVLIGSGIVGLHGTGAQVSPLTLNTTGATLLIAVVVAFNAPGTIADSVGGQTNTWNALTTYQSKVSSFATVTIFYAFAATGGGPLHAGSGHTFTPGASFASCSIFAVSGTLTTSAVFDVANGVSDLTTSPFQPGSITPAATDIVVAGFCASPGAQAGTTITGSGQDGGWTTPLLLTNNTDDFAGAAILFNASGNAVNPTWTVPAGTAWGADIAAFKI